MVFLSTDVLSILVRADGFKILDLQRVAIDMKYFYLTAYNENLHDPPTSEWNLHIDTNMLEYGYLNSTVHSLAVAKHFRLVGLNVNAGVHVTSWLDVGVEHWSKHYLDGIGPWTHAFPTYDSVNVRLNLFNKNSVKALFKQNFIPNWR
jgi:hypothetical protein